MVGHFSRNPAHRPDGNAQNDKISALDRFGHRVAYAITQPDPARSLTRAFAARGDRDHEPTHLVGTHVDITQRKKTEFFVQRHAEILEMIATGEPAPKIYDAIALMYEERHPGLRCSMLELNGNTVQGITVEIDD